MQKLLVRLAGLLNRNQVKFLVFGGIASVKYGAPRATFDIDIILKKGGIPKNFLDMLQSEEICPVEGITFNEFINSQYSIFRDGQGNEVDFWLKVDGFEFDEDSWRHRVDEKINSIMVHFMSPEDIVSGKLSIAFTENDIIDVISILVVNAKNFDKDYFSAKVERFKLKKKLQDLILRMRELMDEEDIKDYIKKAIDVLEQIK